MESLIPEKLIRPFMEEIGGESRKKDDQPEMGVLLLPQVR